MILDGIVCASFENFWYFCPFISLFSVLEIENEFLFKSPWRFLNAWIKVIVPPFTAGLTFFPWEVVCYLGPFLWTKLFHKVNKFFILLCCPVTIQLVSLSYSSVLNLPPAVQTLLVRPTLNLLGNFHPISFAKLFHCYNQPLIFLLSPISAPTTW